MAYDLLLSLALQPTEVPVKPRILLKKRVARTVTNLPICFRTSDKSYNLHAHQFIYQTALISVLSIPKVCWGLNEITEIKVFFP